MFSFKKKNKYNVLPNIGRSYAVGKTESQCPCIIA